MSISKNSAIAFAPATVANLACGFDVLGLAVMSPGDVVTATLHSDEGTPYIESITGDLGVLPKEAHLNTASVAVLKLCEATGFKQSIGLRIEKQMPLGSGMGSSAASAVAAVVAANALLEHPLPKADLLPFVMEAERIACGSAHADNVAPSLLGGIVLVRSYNPLDIISLPVPADLAICIVHPALEVKTSTSRAILRRQVDLQSATQQWGNLAGLVAALFRSDYELIGRCLVDVIAEPVRSPLIPNFLGVKNAAMSAGALGCSISGSGPSVFAICKGIETAQQVGKRMVEEFANIDIIANAYVSLVNTKGATLR